MAEATDKDKKVKEPEDLNKQKKKSIKKELNINRKHTGSQCGDFKGVYGV